MMTFGEMVYNRRITLGETQTEYGRRFGFQASSVCLWEQGKRRVPEVVMQELLRGAFPTYKMCDKCNGVGMIKES